MLGITGFVLKMGGEHALANTIFFILLGMALAYGISPLWWKPSKGRGENRGDKPEKFQQGRGKKRSETILLRRKDAHDRG